MGIRRRKILLRGHSSAWAKSDFLKNASLYKTGLFESREHSRSTFMLQDWGIGVKISFINDQGILFYCLGGGERQSSVAPKSNG